MAPLMIQLKNPLPLQRHHLCSLLPRYTIHSWEMLDKGTDLTSGTNRRRRVSKSVHLEEEDAPSGGWDQLTSAHKTCGRASLPRPTEMPCQQLGTSQLVAGGSIYTKVMGNTTTKLPASLHCQLVRIHSHIAVDLSILPCGP